MHSRFDEWDVMCDVGHESRDDVGWDMMMWVGT